MGQGQMPTLDGVARSEAQEIRINDAFASVMKTEAGNFIMGYLKSITVNRAGGVDISDNHLRHLEGQRYLVFLMEKRIQMGQENKE